MDESGMRDQEVRDALAQHWAVSDSGDFATEHDIYLEDAVLDYPQIPRANSRPTQHTDHTDRSTEQQAICGSSNHWKRRLVGERACPDLRWSTLLHREHHGVPRSQS